MFGVKRTIYSSTVYTELGGIYSLHIECIILLNTDSDNCIKVACYKILYDNCEILGHKNCHGYILLRYINQNCGFFWNWDRQLINKSSLLCKKQRNFDYITQSMYADIKNSKNFFTSIWLWVPYLTLSQIRKAIPSKYKKCCKVNRLSSHALAIETGRYNKTNRNDKFNSDYVEDEFHFIFVQNIMTIDSVFLRSISGKSLQCLNYCNFLTVKILQNGVI